MISVNARSLFEAMLPYRIKWKGDQGITRCPFHHDQIPSFSVNAAKGVWNCHTACGGGSIHLLAEKLGVDPPVFLPQVEQMDQRLLSPKNQKHEQEYVYTDLNGKPVFLVGRITTAQGKKFVMYHYNNSQWYLGKGGHADIPYNLPKVISAVARGLPVIIVEGEKDADTLNRMFRYNQLVATTNMGGATNWVMDSQYNSVFTNADIYIIPDNDDAGRKHAQHVAEAVSRFAKSVRFFHLPELPPKGDVTDWFDAGHMPEELLTLMRSYISDQAPLKVDVDARQKYFDGGRFVPALLAKDILHFTDFYYDGKQLFTYRDGVYRANGELTVRQLCQRMLGNEYVKNRVGEVAHYIETATLVEPESINLDDGQISLLNGLIDLTDQILKPHTSDRLSTVQLPVVYDPNAICPQIEAFLAEVIPADAIPTVIEFIGYCLVMNAKFEKALMLTGSGANGKSTFIKLVAAFLGNNNTTSIPLHELSDHRFKRADLQGKLLNSFADISSILLETSSIFKSVVSGDEIDAERKGQTPFYFKPYAKLLFSANEPPGSKDMSPAFLRRWIIVSFPHNFVYGRNADPDLVAKLTTPDELSGLLNLALEGLKRLRSNQQFTENESTQQAMENYIAEVDNVVGFVAECCALVVDVCFSTTAMFDRYRNWCEHSGVKPLGKIHFNKRLQEQFPGLTKGRKHQQPEHWVGITVTL